MASILDEFLILFKPTIQGKGFSQINRQLRTTFNNLLSVKNLLNLVSNGGFNKLTNSVRSSAVSLRRFKGITDNISSISLRQLNGQLKLTQGNLARVRSLSNKLNSSAGRAGRRTSGGGGLLDPRNLMAGFIGYDVYTGTKEILGSVINATREMGAMRSRFYAITGDMGKANEQLQWAFDLAQRTAMPMKSLADSYSIFYAATQKGLGDTGAQQVFQDWTEVSRVLHMSEYQFERVTYALREMASKGVVYSQDLRMQIGTHVPNAVGLAEKAVNDLGITGTDWFEKFQKQSKGNQKMINQFLLLFSKYAKEMFANPEALAKALQQPDAQIIRLFQQWDKFRYALVDSGFTDDLLNFLLHVNNLLDKITGHAKESYEIIKDIVKILGVVLGVKFITKGISLLRTFLPSAGKLFAVFGRFGKILTKKGFGKFFTVIMRLFWSKALGLGVKGFLLALPTGITQVVGALWLVWDVLSLIWDLLKLKFPNQMMALKFNILTFLNNCVAGCKNFFHVIGYWFTVTLPNIIKGVFAWFTGLGKKISDWWSNLPFNRNKNSINITPSRGAWDNIYKQSSITPLARYGMGTSQNSNNISFNNQITIDASGLTEEQAANMIANSQEDVVNRVSKQLGMSIANSKVG